MSNSPEDRPKPQQNMENQLMGGCMVIGISSIVIFGLGVWPWIAIQDYTTVGLLKVLGFGALPALIAGWFLVRKSAAAGLAGFLGGASCFGIFMYLRLTQLFVASGNPDAADVHHLDLPPIFQVLIPLVWAIVSIGLAVISYPKTSELG